MDHCDPGAIEGETVEIFILGLSNRHRRELFSSVALAVTR